MREIVVKAGRSFPSTAKLYSLRAFPCRISKAGNRSSDLFFDIDFFPSAIPLQVTLGFGPLFTTSNFSLQSSIGHINVVKSPASVSLGATEQDDMYAKLPADRTGTT